eukprot:gene34016-43948_t
MDPSDPWSSVGLAYLSFYSYLMASCTLCLTVISTRCARMDVLFTKVNPLFSFLFQVLTAGLVTLEKRLFDPLDLTSKVLSPFHLQAREAGIDLRLEPSATLSPAAAVRLRADPYKISQVIRNLVSNALKFTGRGGSVRLSLSVEMGCGEGEGDGDDDGDADIETGQSTRTIAAASFVSRALGRSTVRYSKTFAEVNYLVMTVHDSGVGISAVITKQIVEQHGGTVSVQSQGEGEGSVFTVRLPCIVGSDDGEEELFDMDEDADRKLHHSKTSRLLRASFLNTMNDNALPSWTGDDDPSADSVSEILLPGSSPRADDAVQEIEALEPMRVLVVDDSDMNRKMVCKVLTATKEFH